MLLLIDSTIEHLEGAVSYWSQRFQDLYALLTTDPTKIQNGSAWNTVVDILNILEGVGATLVVLFFFWGLLKTSVDYRDFVRQPKALLMSLFRVGIAEFFVTNTKEILVEIITFIQQIISSLPIVIPAQAQAVPAEIYTALESASWWSKLGTWIVSLLGNLSVKLLVIIIIVVVYARFFKVFLLTAVAPMPLAGFSSEATSGLAINFLKSYIAELLRGALMLVACSIFTAFISSGTFAYVVNAGDGAFGMVTNYVMSLIMQLLLLVITVKGSDRLVKEIFGLGG